MRGESEPTFRNAKPLLRTKKIFWIHSSEALSPNHKEVNIGNYI
jgi:hypothetical protein